jgi:hypothetical protein
MAPTCLSDVCVWRYPVAVCKPVQFTSTNGNHPVNKPVPETRKQIDNLQRNKSGDSISSPGKASVFDESTTQPRPPKLWGWRMPRYCAPPHCGLGAPSTPLHTWRPRSPRKHSNHPDPVWGDVGRVGVVRYGGWPRLFRGAVAVWMRC